MVINEWCMYSIDIFTRNNNNNKAFRLTSSKGSPGSISVHTKLKLYGRGRIFVPNI